MDRFGPDNFSTLQIKGRVLHRARPHLKVPAWLLVWNALLNKVIAMFFKQRVSPRVEPGISFLYRKYLGDEAIKFPLFKKKVVK